MARRNLKVAIAQCGWWDIYPFLALYFANGACSPSRSAKGQLDEAKRLGTSSAAFPRVKPGAGAQVDARKLENRIPSAQGVLFELTLS